MTTYIRQKNTGELIIAVIGNAAAALAEYPDLFEEVEGSIPIEAELLNYESGVQ